MILAESKIGEYVPHSAKVIDEEEDENKEITNNEKSGEYSDRALKKKLK